MDAPFRADNGDSVTIPVIIAELRRFAGQVKRFVWRYRRPYTDDKGGLNADREESGIRAYPNLTHAFQSQRRHTHRLIADCITTRINRPGRPAAVTVKAKLKADRRPTLRILGGEFGILVSLKEQNANVRPDVLIACYDAGKGEELTPTRRMSGRFPK